MLKRLLTRCKYDCVICILVADVCNIFQLDFIPFPPPSASLIKYSVYPYLYSPVAAVNKSRGSIIKVRISTSAYTEEIQSSTLCGIRLSAS